jgi:hypothetical protein
LNVVDTARLFEERWSEIDESFRRDYGISPSADDFFREVLLSYRLIFGQDKRSWEAYRRSEAAKEQKRSRSSKEQNPQRQQRPPDPLLPILCSKNWRSSSDALIVYREIDADEDVSNHYSVTDFPFFGQRLLHLQRFSKDQNPHDWIVLWHDRRNVFNWWTIWAVVFIGGGAVVLAILTLVFQILQTFLKQSPTGA